MRSATSFFAAAALAVAALGVAPASHADGPAVTMVFIAQVAPADRDAYLASLKEGQAIIQGLGLPGFSVLQATAAGDATGSLAIIVNAENLMTWAENTTKLQADAGWQAWVAKQQQSGVANIVSQNLWVEVLPQ